MKSDIIAKIKQNVEYSEHLILTNEGLESEFKYSEESVSYQSFEKEAYKIIQTNLGRGVSSYIWHQEIQNMEFHSVSINAPYVIAGAGTSYWYSVLECAALDGYGSPLWTIQKPNTNIVSNAMGLSAVVSYGDQTTVFEMYSGSSSEPVWTFMVPEYCLPIHRHSVVMANLNNLVVGAVTVVGGESYFARVYWFDAYGSPTFLDLAPGTMIRDIAISSDGLTVSAMIKDGIYVFMTISGNFLNLFLPLDSPATEMCMSGDGNTIGYGWQGLQKKRCFSNLTHLFLFS